MTRWNFVSYDNMIASHLLDLDYAQFSRKSDPKINIE